MNPHQSRSEALRAPGYQPTRPAPEARRNTFQQPRSQALRPAPTQTARQNPNAYINGPVNMPAQASTPRRQDSGFGGEKVSSQAPKAYAPIPRKPVANPIQNHRPVIPGEILESRNQPALDGSQNPVRNPQARARKGQEARERIAIHQAARQEQERATKHQAEALARLEGRIPEKTSDYGRRADQPPTERERLMAQDRKARQKRVQEEIAVNKRLDKVAARERDLEAAFYAASAERDRKDKEKAERKKQGGGGVRGFFGL